VPNLSGLKAEILSASDIGKITNAMYLVAAAKLRKIGQRVNQTKEYVSEVYDIFNDIIIQTKNSPFLKPENTEFKKTLWVVINSNLGLCGGYNNNINKLVINKIKTNDAVYAIGSKAVSYYSARKITIAKERTDIEVDFTSQQASEIGKELMQFYINGEYDQIKIGYTKFINNVTFDPTILRLFPIIKNENNLDKKHNRTFDFEPSAEIILEKTINLYLNTILYGTIIESQVSEQASRRLAMENATNNGEELIQELKIKYNRERQAIITQEIFEIIGGANALNK